MPKLPLWAQKILKLLHLLGVSLWLGGGVAINLLPWLMPLAPNDQALVYFYQIIDFLDREVVVRGAMLTLATGIVYGLFTHWGFIRHRWIMLKWLITIAIIYSGASITSGVYLHQLSQLALSQGLQAVNTPAYQSLSAQNLSLGALQLALLALAVALSIWKKPGPWRKTAR